MSSNKSTTPPAFLDEMQTQDFRLSRSGGDAMSGRSGSDRMFSAFDDFLDRMPAWIFHTLGLITALVALWFALAFLGGLPRVVVEWITLAMFGAFAYAVGFMIPLIVTYFAETAGRLLLAALLAGGSVIFGAMTLSLPL
jgi:hypothetical protein